MSDSEDSNHVAPASNAQLEQALRHAVEKTYKSNPELLTVRKLRGIVEKELCLNDGFFKSDATWNARSKEVIQSEVVR